MRASSKQLSFWFQQYTGTAIQPNDTLNCTAVRIFLYGPARAYFVYETYMIIGAKATCSATPGATTTTYRITPIVGTWTKLTVDATLAEAAFVADGHPIGDISSGGIDVVGRSQVD